MPIYEYQCAECGHQLEALQKISDEPLRDCPKCQKQTLNKLVSAAGFQLKGSGWYVTDYKSKPTTSADNTSSTSTGSDGGKSDSSSSNGS
jgi:putative FmdB family regulatory protein